jgi:hypothetical protein
MVVASAGNAYVITVNRNESPSTCGSLYKVIFHAVKKRYRVQ